MKNQITDVFQLYQKGIDYKTRIGYFEKCDLFWNFYNSIQWGKIKKSELPAITINQIKQQIDYKTSSLMSQSISINYSAEMSADEIDGLPDDMANNIIMDKAYAELLTAIVARKYEVEKMPTLLREILLNGAVTGDMAFYTYWDPTVKTYQPELGNTKTIALDGANIFFQDANVSDVQAQQWVIVSGRDSVYNLREEAKRYGAKQEEIDKIQADTDTEYQIGTNGKIEMDYGGDDGKALYLIKFWKDNGVAKWCKKTKYATIRSEVDLGISRYPIGYRNWYTIKNSMHGMSETEGQIDNQIAINQLNSLVVLWMKHNAFGKTIYDGDRIQNWSNSVTGAIKSNGDLNGAVLQLQPGNFNQAIVNFAQILLSTIKTTNGVNDAALGQVDPKNTSAIITTIKQSGIPLENVQANLYQLVEDWALIEAEYIQNKYKDRYVAIKKDNKTGMVKYVKPSESFIPNVNVEIGPSSYYNETIGMNALDRLFEMGKIDDVEYFSRMKKFNIIPDAEGLIKTREERMRTNPQDLINQMSPEMRAEFESLPPEQQQAMLAEFMG